MCMCLCVFVSQQCTAQLGGTVCKWGWDEDTSLHWPHGHSGSAGPPAQWKIGNSDADDAFVEQDFHQLLLL